MTRYLIDFEAGCFRPVWTNNEVIGFLVEYLDANDKSPAEEQMAKGYQKSSGQAPYPMKPEEWVIENGKLVSLKYRDEDDPCEELSRCTAGDGSTVIMFDYALTAVVRDGKIVWLARLD